LEDDLKGGRSFGGHGVTSRALEIEVIGERCLRDDDR